VNGDRGRDILRKAERVIEKASLDEVPARTTTIIHRILREETGLDPYKKVKDTYNRVALEMLPDLRRRAERADDRLEYGVRAAIAGNVIDFGIYESIDLDRALEESFRLPLTGGVYPAFARAVDRLLIEILRDMGKKVTAAVKGSPVINDATLDDARAAGLHECSAVVDNGNDGIGTLLDACSPRFLEQYRSADLIISKGQANYETLVQERDERIFFLFKVKCPVVAACMERSNGDIVLSRGSAAKV
jgi:hypothetical protein